jgi:hypothetical protein
MKKLMRINGHPDLVEHQGTCLSVHELLPNQLAEEKSSFFVVQRYVINYCWGK